MSTSFTEKDLLVISRLRNNARETLTDMSLKTGIPVSTIYEKLRMQLRQHILAYKCLIDFVKLGFSIKAMVTLKVDKEQKQDLLSYLQKHKNINTLCRINNSFDFFVEVVFRELKDLEEFLETLDVKFKLKQRNVYFVIEEVKREAFLSEPEFLSMLMPEVFAASTPKGKAPKGKG